MPCSVFELTSLSGALRAFICSSPLLTQAILRRSGTFLVISQQQNFESLRLSLIQLSSFSSIKREAAFASISFKALYPIFHFLFSIFKSSIYFIFNFRELCFFDRHKRHSLRFASRCGYRLEGEPS